MPPTEAGLYLQDGARPDPDFRLTDLDELRRLAGAADLPVERRLEAFEDIFDSEVGDTHFGRARNFERELNLRQLFLKFEGGNPTGTQKDRIAFAQTRDALRRGFDTITVATCGNYGAAVALAASIAGLRCLIYIPEGYHTRRLEEMTRHRAEIIRFPGDYEGTVQASRERAERDDFYDANPGGANTDLQLDAYGEIANEIYDELRDAPAVVAVPASNGTTLAGIHKGFVRLYRRGKTSRVPRIVAGSAAHKNPIVRSFVRGLPRCVDLDPARVRETAINEPLINWHSYDGDHALDALRSSGGWADHVSDRAMLRLARQLADQEGLNVLPASTAGLAVMLARHATTPLAGDRYVAILTGRK
ncbi:MAG: pyridoxal-phosphate dependent enzyme [Acidobacteria bacterium]|nr:pyridoxal-phosphate dependent enzyme [Acidobacteriota bacterium]